MKNKTFSANFIELNVAIVFLSTSGVLGKYIDMPVPITLALRASIAGIIVYIFCTWKGLSFRIDRSDWSSIFWGSILFAAHWVLYFYALQLSNVAIGMITLFTYPAITAVLEPLFLRTKLLRFHLFLSLLVLVGVYFLVPEFDIHDDKLKAVGFGLLAALTYSLRNIVLKSKIHKYNGSILMAYQLLITSICLCPFFLFLDSSKVVYFLPATIALALFTTAIGHTMFLYSFKYFSIITASIISCAQPVYGIIFGLLFLSEYPQTTTLIGGSIVIFTVIAESLRVYRLSRKSLSGNHLEVQ